MKKMFVVGGFLAVLVGGFFYNYVIPTHPRVILSRGIPESIVVGIGGYSTWPNVSNEEIDYVVGMLNEHEIDESATVEGRPYGEAYKLMLAYNKLIGGSVVTIYFYEEPTGNYGLINHSYVDGVSYLNDQYYRIDEPINDDLSAFINERVEEYKSTGK